jgi:hypothetical protein
MIGTGLILHSLLYGGILSLLLGAVILGSMSYNAELWLNDYPPDVRAKYGPPSPRTKQQRKWVSIPFLIILVGTLAAAALTLETATGTPPTFLTLFLTIFLVFTVFNLFDLLVIDLLVGMAIRPNFSVLPGTEGMAGYHNVGYHVVAFLKGTAGGLVFALVLAGIFLLVV